MVVQRTYCLITADKGVRAQSPNYHSVSQTIPPHFSKDSTGQTLRISKYCYEGTRLNNLIYTKLVPFTSRKKRTLRPFLFPFLRIIFYGITTYFLCAWNQKTDPINSKTLKVKSVKVSPFHFGKVEIQIEIF